MNPATSVNDDQFKTLDLSISLASYRVNFS